MKKAAPYALVFLTILLAIFLIGFYCGRNANRYPVQMSILPSYAAEALSSESLAIEEISDDKININTASGAMLQTLPGIGEVLAQRIIEYREENGPFSDLAGLLNVEGIGEKKLEAILELATVGG